MVIDSWKFPPWIQPATLHVLMYICSCCSWMSLLFNTALIKTCYAVDTSQDDELHTTIIMSYILGHFCIKRDWRWKHLQITLKAMYVNIQYNDNFGITHKYVYAHAIGITWVNEQWPLLIHTYTGEGTRSIPKMMTRCHRHQSELKFALLTSPTSVRRNMSKQLRNYKVISILVRYLCVMFNFLRNIKKEKREQAQ